MPYTPLVLDPSTPEPIHVFVADRIESVLRQVRALLALPVTPETDGIELVVAPALFSVLNGLSQVFFNALVGEKPSFLAVAERYSADHEPGNAIKDAKRFADLLHVHHRANLVHGLGLNMLRDGRFEPWRMMPLSIDGKPMRLKLARTRALPVTEGFLTALESPAGGVAGAGATLSFTVDGLRLELDAFYCGVRRLTRRLAEDRTLQPGATRVLQPWYAELQHWENETATQLLTAGGVPDAMSGTVAGEPARTSGAATPTGRFAAARSRA